MPSHPLPPAEPPPDEELPRRRAGRSALIVEDFRSVRRWLVLLGVLAVAAATVAAYSLLQSEESADRDRVNSLSRSLRDATAQLEEANRQRKLEGRQLERGWAAPARSPTWPSSTAVCGASRGTSSTPWTQPPPADERSRASTTGSAPSQIA